jgi:hypothetical protein
VSHIESSSYCSGLTSSASRSGRVGRVDLGMIRKMNEVCQALLEAGGVLTEMKLQVEHREWTARVAGTDVPSAPAVQYSMDRTFYRRTIALLIGDGRIKSTKAAVPTPTGRWVQTEVLYLSTLPQEDVQAYIRTLASQTAQAMAASGKRRSATRIADANFSEVRVATPVRSASATAKPAQMPTEDLDAVRRETLLKEPTIVAYLYGYKSGRWARARSLHTGIIQAMRNSVGATSIISTTPRIFALPLLFEELSAGTFFECVLTSAHDDDLEKWLRDPAKRQTKLKDMPKHLSPRGGFGSAAVKNKISGLLEAMCELKLLTPLNIEDPDRATLHVHSDAIGADLHFGGADGFGVSAYYIAHEHAPVYHIASDVSGLLGILPLTEGQEIEAYWRAAQAACTEPDINMVEELDCNGPTTWPNTAPLTEVLELDVDLRKMLRAPVRWKHQIRLLPIQRRALDEAIDFRRGERIVTSREEVEKLAYDNALPVEFVDAQLDARDRQGGQGAVPTEAGEGESSAPAKARGEKGDCARGVGRQDQACGGKSWDRVLPGSVGLCPQADVAGYQSCRTQRRSGARGGEAVQADQRDGDRDAGCTYRNSAAASTSSKVQKAPEKGARD